MTEEKHYRFALVSDIHIDRENGGKNTYFIYAERNFKRALEVIKQIGCDFVISAGDQVTNASGAAEEWRVYRDIIDRSGYTGQIYEALGNHETRSAKYGINSIADCVRDFIDNTRLAEKNVIRPTGKPYYTYIEPVFGDAFIFMALENGVDTNETDNFSDEQIEWAKAELEKYTSERRRIFLIQHANIYGYGAGDDAGDPSYAGAVMTRGRDGKVFRNNLRFKKLTEKYRDIIWISGHTHLDLTDGINYAKYPDSCHMLHVPALAGTTRLSFDDSGRRVLDRSFYEESSQGYIVDVFADRTIFRGTSFYFDRTYPRYTYLIPRGEKII